MFLVIQQKHQFVPMILHGGMREKIGNIVVGYLATQANVALCLQEAYQHLRHALLLVVILAQKLVTFQNVIMREAFGRLSQV